MASKLQVQITLMLKDDEGKRKPQRFKSAEWLEADAMDDALDIMSTLEDAEDRKEVKAALQECYTFVANVIFEGQFTAEQYRDGIDAREIAPLTGKFLRSVTQGYDNTYVDTKKK
ncbi:phage tail assembly chaperone G [Enterococcus massiliensis]|uniref:phage tail assembly chaperone G n=1 Tax=Enterococcus massiliensis TaxID=1640685 RepID=UPI00065E7503|nr:hypothetical protein [Enterococcus massiliensis]